MEPGGSHGLQNRSRPDFVGLGGFDSHALPPWRIAPRRIAALALCLITPLLAAQRPDAARIATTSAPTVDSLNPPLSPRRAFLYSFLVPGYSQTVMNRYKTATGFLLFEAVAIAMIRESGADVHEARRTLNDTLILSWVDEAGRMLASPDTVATRFGNRELRSRQAHVEDWVALLVANHLAAGADAYVASHLWDVGARVGFRLFPRGAALTASIRW